jgi:hypothetical protein
MYDTGYSISPDLDRNTLLIRCEGPFHPWPILLLGVHAVTVPHGPDGSVLRSPSPSPFPLIPTNWTDGGRDGLCPSMPVGSTSVTSVRTVGQLGMCSRLQVQLRPSFAIALARPSLTQVVLSSHLQCAPYLRLSPRLFTQMANATLATSSTQENRSRTLPL